KLDAVVLIGGSSIQCLHGQGDGTFQVISLEQLDVGGTSLVAADFSGDGNLDLMVSDVILLGQGNWSFPPGPYIGDARGPGLVAADFNGDGLPDMVFGESASVDVALASGGGY